MSSLIDSSDIVASPLRGNEQLLIGVLLCDRPVLARWVEALNNLRSPVPRGTLVARSAGTDKLREICKAREVLVERVLALETTRYLFFLDDDVIVTPNTLEELFAAMHTTRAAVVGACYHGRGNVDTREWQVWDESHRWYNEIPARPFRSLRWSGGRGATGRPEGFR